MLTDLERRRRLGVRHRLTPGQRTDDLSELTDSVVALHASDPATVFLAACARMIHPSIEAVERALYESRLLVRHHAMRRTAWVMNPDTARRAHASSTRKIAGAERRKLLKMLEENSEIADPETWLPAAMTEVLDAVERTDLMTTRELGDALPHLRVPITFPASAGASTDIPAHARLILLAGFEGSVVRARPLGSWIGSQYRWSAADRWLPGGLDTMTLRAGAAELLQHWLERFGPGTDADLRWWTGWTAAQTRTALADIGAEQIGLEDGPVGWVAAGDGRPMAEAERPEPWVGLLPGLDPSAMGWKQRHWYLNDEIAARVVDRNGNIGPTIWADGEVVGGWVQRADGELALEILRPLSEDHRDLLDIEVVRVQRFVGDSRFRVRFPSPNQRDLLSEPERY